VDPGWAPRSAGWWLTRSSRPERGSLHRRLQRSGRGHHDEPGRPLDHLQL